VLSPLVSEKSSLKFWHEFAEIRSLNRGACASNLIKEFVEHYMTERFHQGIGSELIRKVGPTNDNGADGKVACRSRLGGLLNFYYREAA
jgi:hypothetical protein